MIISDCWLGFRGWWHRLTKVWPKSRVWLSLTRSSALIMPIQNLVRHTSAGLARHGPPHREAAMAVAHHPQPGSGALRPKQETIAPSPPPPAAFLGAGQSSDNPLRWQWGREGGEEGAAAARAGRAARVSLEGGATRGQGRAVFLIIGITVSCKPH
jgi:hypothetical protein